MPGTKEKMLNINYQEYLICSIHSEQEFLIKLFSTLENRNIIYCVLRNYESLPFSTNGSDIDILIDKQDFANTLEIIENVARSFNGRIIAELKANCVRSLSICGYYKKKWWGIKFDVFSSYVGTNGIDILSAATVLERKHYHNNVWVADDGDAAIIAFLKEIIGAGGTRKNYTNQAYNAFSLHRERYISSFKHYFGGKATTTLIEPLLSGKNQNFSRAQKSLKKAWLFNMVGKKTFMVVQRRFQDFILKIKRLISPLGFSVAFIGTDGSGKSTIIEGIRPPLEAALHSSLKYEHMRPNLLPSLAKLFGKETHELGKPVTNPHGNTPSGTFGSFVRLFYYSIDYILGYWLKVYLDKARKPCLYVFDRYFYDFIIDPMRSRISLPKKIIELFQFIIPEPDLIICLGTDPKTIHARKPELPLNEIKRQVQELKVFCRKKSKKAIWIDTGLPIEESINQALSAIIERMAARYD